MCELRQFQAQVPALRDQPHRPRSEVIPGQVEQGAGVGDAQAVRSEHHGARCTHPSDRRLLEGKSSLIAFAKA